jgi:hypothetical protein
MTRIITMLTVAAVFAALVIISALPGVAAPRSCADNPSGCKTSTGGGSSVGVSTVQNKNFSTTSTVSSTTSTTQRGNFNQGTQGSGTSSGNTSTIPGGCTNPGGQPNCPHI